MADITEQDAKFGDTDNTLLLKAAKALQTLADGGVVAAAGTLTGDILAENVQQANILYNFDGTKTYAYVEDIKQRDTFGVAEIAPGPSIPIVLATIAAMQMQAISMPDGTLNYVMCHLDAAKWAGKTARMYALFSGNLTQAASNFAVQFALCWRNTALNGATAVAYSPGGSYDGTDSTGVVARPAPTVADALILSDYGSNVVIPADVTALSMWLYIPRANGLDTYNGILYLHEMRLQEV